MPVKPEGVYSDGRGQWYFKVSLGRDQLSGKREQLTRRGFHTATEASKARHAVLVKSETNSMRPNGGSLTVNELLDIYLDGIDADERLSLKTRFDYRHKAADYVRPSLGRLKLRDVTAATVLSWQRGLLQNGEGSGTSPLRQTLSAWLARHWPERSSSHLRVGWLQSIRLQALHDQGLAVRSRGIGHPSRLESFSG